MTAPTEKWRSRENPYNVWLTVDAVVELYDYAVQLEREKKYLSDHNERMRQALDRDAQRHPLYGPCDGFDDGACAECNRMFEALQRDNDALSVNAENLVLVRKQRDEALDIARKLLACIRLEHYCLCGHGAARHNNAAHCSDCTCKAYDG